MLSVQKLSKGVLILISLIACQPVVALANPKDREVVKIALDFNPTKGIVLKVNSKLYFAVGSRFLDQFKQQMPNAKKDKKGFLINFKYEF